MNLSDAEKKAVVSAEAQLPDDFVFGLDIGTRSIVGTVGYRQPDGHFVVVAQAAVQHETRAMLDGQIHDIGKVADTIRSVSDQLEQLTGKKLNNVCIAAAGRVLKTVEQEAEVTFTTETVVTTEHVYSLDMLAVEKAHETLRQSDNSGLKYYCVGYSVMRYYQNDYPITNLEGHKCSKIRTELIATFLPEEVVDGLYAAVERAGLHVENLTLEPIAAINIAIPERFRLLNIALVDVGAGTSDISITKDGSIIAYGMIPAAGDELTECIAKHYLVDFQEADRMKCESTEQEEVEFQDIMGLPMTVKSSDIAEVVRENVQSITKQVAEKIIELNGDKSVSAVFVVGGGGKITGAHGISVTADITDNDVIMTDKVEMIVLPGGMPGTLNLEKSPVVQAAIKFCADNKKAIGAICAAPSIIGKLGLLKGKKATCFPGFEQFLEGAMFTGDLVNIDDNIVTAKGAGAAKEKPRR